MRLWHYSLIHYLPNAQLKSMRYEIGDMIKQYPNIKNRLVSYANNYDVKFLWSLFTDILEEFDKRGIKHKASYDKEIKQIVKSKSANKLWNIFYCYKEHDDRYLVQCLHNLQEKFDRRNDIKN